MFPSLTDKLIVLILFWSLSILQPVAAGEAGPELDELSLTDLANVQVTSVARKPQRLAHSPAAVYVISRKDIRRSGATTLPEALRLAPGLDVARIESHAWAISARGFNGRYANKLLVLVDGRTVYTPLFSGVFWDALDMPLEDIERIEVIRGPGATMWGANAVNGVINIITRSAVDTQGNHVSLVGGDLDRITTVRHGGGSGNLRYRLYGRYSGRRRTEMTDGIGNSGHRIGTGFRADWNRRDDKLQISGDYTGSEMHDPTRPIASLENPVPALSDMNSRPYAASLLGHWRRILGEENEISVQVSHARTRRSEFLGKEIRDTFDVDFQHRFSAGYRNDVEWGVQTRTTSDLFTGVNNVSFVPAGRRDTLYAGFVQDELALVPNILHLIGGVKVEQNSYLDAPQAQPSVKAVFSPSARHAAWGAVSRAIRAPARFDSDLRIALDPAQDASGLWIFPVRSGGLDLLPEKMTAYETGYRWQGGRLSADVALFHNRYSQLMTGEFSSVEFVPSPVPHIMAPLTMANKGSGSTEGAELSAFVDASPSLRIQTTYSLQSTNLEVARDSVDSTLRAMEMEAPHHLGRVSAYWDITRSITFDTSFYGVSRRESRLEPQMGTKPVHIPGYVSVVSRIAWSPREDVELSLTADNLLNRRHQEFQSAIDWSGRESEYFGRSVRLGVSWDF